MTIYSRSEELVSRCIECNLAEPESLASLGGSAPGLVDGILSDQAWCYGSHDITKITLKALCHISKTAVKKGGSYRSEIFHISHRFHPLRPPYLIHLLLPPPPPPPPIPHSSASNMGDEADDDEYTDYDEAEVEFAQMQQSMLLNVSTLVQLWESVTNQSQGALVKQSRIPCPFVPHLSWEVFISSDVH